MTLDNINLEGYEGIDFKSFLKNVKIRQKRNEDRMNEIDEKLKKLQGDYEQSELKLYNPEQ